MDPETNAKHAVLERLLLDANAEPMDLPLSLLEDITNGFSDDRKIGSGGFAVVYKGILGKGMVAVKKLSETFDIRDDKFKDEVSCLMMAKHENIVRFLGHCSDTQVVEADYEGKTVLADLRQRMLCFEYLPKGSLDNCITGIHEWRKRYEIIKGICKGLHYLHVKWRIVHLDLKPANILLDDHMEPKIADFGLSRRFDEEQSRVLTSNLNGTWGYLAPEFLSGEITFKLDIYSLGIIITEILTGQKGYFEVENALDIWRRRSQKSKENIQFEQIRVCAEIGIRCTKRNPEKRPLIQNIIDRLDGRAGKDWFINASVSSSSVGQVNSPAAQTSSWPLVLNLNTYRVAAAVANAAIAMCCLFSSPAATFARTAPAAGTSRATTLLMLYGQYDKDQKLLASAATSLSLEDDRFQLSNTPPPGVGGEDGSFHVTAYMDALRARFLGRWMIWSPLITSTHDLMSRNFHELPVGAVCVAHKQSKGRGRSKNGWKSPPGCLMFSFTLQFHDGHKVALIQYLICVVMIEAIKELSCAKGLPELDVKIKWPNDLYLNGLKVGGILSTASYEAKVFNMCIGIGLNVDNEKPTTCLNGVLRELKADSPGLKREDILSSFFNKFEVLFEIFSNQGFHALEKRYYKLWLHSGQRVVVQDASEVQDASGGQSVDYLVTIQGLTPSGYLSAIGDDGKSYELRPDGNSFDFFAGLVRRKTEGLACD